jgi:hypothetical protein
MMRKGQTKDGRFANADRPLFVAMQMRTRTLDAAGTRKMKRQTYFALVILAVMGVSWAQPAYSQFRYITVPPSKIWIEGGATIGSYQCANFAIRGIGKLASAAALKRDTIADDTVSSGSAQAAVEVDSFRCNDSRMNGDLRDAMQSEKNPEILYVLVSSNVGSVPDTAGGWYTAATEGELTIAGTKRTIDMTINVRQETGGAFHVTGSKEVLMSDFKITPPSAFFGLIKAKNELTVHFDLLVVRDETTPMVVVN